MKILINIASQPALIMTMLAIVTPNINAQDGQQADKRLRLDPLTTETTQPPIEISGVVARQNKYSIDVEANGKLKNIKIDKRTEFVMDVSSPRVDFNNSKLTVAIRGEQRKFREYSFEGPLFMRAAFAHKHQYDRVMSSDEKRLGNYEIGSKATALTDDKKRIYLCGELQAGDTDRKHVLVSGSERHQIILAKNGQWSGFSLLSLTPNDTGVRILAAMDADGQVIAKRIHFWPVLTKSTSQ